MRTTRLQRIRIATWNCFGVPPTVEDLIAGRPFWPERFASRAVAAALSPYDVVCIQENMVNGVLEGLERLRCAAGFAELWFDPMGPDAADGTFVGGGLAILSRFPLSARFSRLARGEGPDGFARKGLALAEVRLPGGRAVAVLNTHLQADDERVPLAACRRARREQIAAVGAIARELAARREPLVLCGDLNVAADSDEYDEIRGALGPDLADVGAEAGTSTYDVERNDLARAFHTGGPLRARLDYVWSSRGLAATGVRVLLDEPIEDSGAPPAPCEARGFASDHFAVGAELELVE